MGRSFNKKGASGLYKLSERKAVERQTSARIVAGISAAISEQNPFPKQLPDVIP